MIVIDMSIMNGRRLSEAHGDQRRHFFAAPAGAMRRLLSDNARRKQRDRHGGGRRRVELPDLPAAAGVQLRLYVGLSVEEAAEALGLSRTHAYRHWTYARAWLRAALGGGTAGP